jgi:hypothetical protein
MWIGSTMEVIIDVEIDEDGERLVLKRFRSGGYKAGVLLVKAGGRLIAPSVDVQTRNRPAVAELQQPRVKYMV